VKKLRKKLPVVAAEFPPMRCDVGCGDCCGPAPATQAEFDRVVDYIRRHKIVPKDQGITCPLYLDGKCSVYEVRPLACRAFGHVEGMDCSRGYNTNLPVEQVDAKLIVNGETTTVLHEVLSLNNPGLTFQGVLHRMTRGANGHRSSGA
jgi:Fe-S-cluster containining protein